MILMFELALLLTSAFSLRAQVASPAASKTESLKLVIFADQQIITSPSPARIKLHLLNPGREPLWLYHRARDPARIEHLEALHRQESLGSQGNSTSGGAELTVRLEPAVPAEVANAAQGSVVESVGLPHPKLVKLNSGEDYEEKTVIQLAPATGGVKGEGKPFWGRYRLRVNYRARFSNAEEIRRNLGAEVWEGDVTSNSIELELRPPEARAKGSVAGTVLGPSQHPLPEVIVSLSDEQERAVAQILTGDEGRFSFTGLPLGLYWVTARFASAATDTVVFRHLELTPDQPAGSVEFTLTPQEVYEPKSVLHKPVLFRVKDAAGRPLNKVALEITWSNGPVLDHVKGEVSDDGTAALELIPGRNFVTLKRRGCPKLEQRVDVAEGDGIDDFALTFECAKK